MSGGEPSSIKRSPRCAVRKPVLSSDTETCVFAAFDFKVYGRILQLDFYFSGGETYASGTLQKMASEDV